MPVPPNHSDREAPMGTESQSHTLVAAAASTIDLPRASACPRPGAQSLGGQATSIDNLSDESLAARVAGGDRRAIELLFTRHKHKVYRFALRLGADSATAEDIVSDVFIDLWRHAAKFQGRAKLSTWLLAIARNKALSAKRGRVGQPLDDALVQTIPDPAVSVEDRVDADKRRVALRKCVERLSRAHREIIDLVYYHEKSVEEVAAILGAPAATVKTRMFYARRRLSELLAGAGIEGVGR
jgi:RNA polymerase sigma-70 factor, ECF subfamily